MPFLINAFAVTISIKFELTKTICFFPLPGAERLAILGRSLGPALSLAVRIQLLGRMVVRTWLCSLVRLMYPLT